MSTPLEIVILAAGKGTRMRSALPKVLHELAGQPLVTHVIRAAQALAPRAIHVVYGHGGDLLPQRLAAEPVRLALQAEQKGTGHAVAQAMPAVGRDATVLVLYGDVPLTRVDTLRPLTEAAAAGRLALLTANLADPSGYGRIVRDAAARVRAIVEHKDATADQRAIGEINTGILAAPAAMLQQWLGRLQNSNAQGEYYLTDIVAMAVAEGIEVAASQPQAEWEILGVNSKTQLAELERIHQRNRAQALMEQGVTLMDPARLDVRGTLHCGQDVVIDVNCVFEGEVTLEDGARIGPNNHIRNCRIGAGTLVHANCVLEDAVVGPDCRIGPFARLRPGAELAAQAHVGNFVEIKKSRIGTGSKVNHLSYVGDSEVGSGVNIGAGTITCNYDGANKHQTIIGDNAFIGSNTALVAPLTVGAGATIGAGTTLNKDAPAGELTVARAKAVSIRGWKRPQKKPKPGG